MIEPAGHDAFRDAERVWLFALLRDFPEVLLLSAHNSTQRHVFDDADTIARAAHATGEAQQQRPRVTTCAGTTT